MKSHSRFALGVGALLVGSPAGCQSAAPPAAPQVVELAAPQPVAADQVMAPAPRATSVAAAAQDPAAPADAPASAPSAPRASLSGSPPGSPPLDWGRCLRWVLCGYEGLCTPTAHGGCIAADSHDCRPSDACLGGRCTARNGRCVAGSDEDCRTSLACTAWGRCYHDGLGACMAKSAADCLASTRCQRERECTLRRGACVRSTVRASRP